MSVSSESGSPTLRFSVFCTNFSINSFAIFFTTKKRFVAIQLCPQLINLPLTAPLDAFSISTSPHTMKGSLPPNSRTVFFSFEVALCAP
jgi:hypothetical protein